MKIVFLNKAMVPNGRTGNTVIKRGTSGDNRQATCLLLTTKLSVDKVFFSRNNRLAIQKEKF